MGVKLKRREPGILVAILLSFVLAGASGAIPVVMANSKPGCATVVVKDMAGKGVSQADVEVLNPSGIRIASGATSNSGRVVLACGILTPGEFYDIRATKLSISSSGGFQADSKGTIFAQIALPL